MVFRDQDEKIHHIIIIRRGSFLFRLKSLILLSKFIYQMRNDSCSTHSGVDLLVEIGLLQLECPGVVLDLRICVVLDVHGCFLALGLSNSGVTVGLSKRIVVECWKRLNLMKFIRRGLLLILWLI